MRERINEIHTDSADKFDIEVGIVTTKEKSKGVSPISVSPNASDMPQVEVAKP